MPKMEAPSQQASKKGMACSLEDEDKDNAGGKNVFFQYLLIVDSCNKIL